LPPATEKGVDATAVPKTLADDGAPNAAKSVTTFLGGEWGIAFGDDGGVLTDDERDGILYGE
jgi:F420-0:gamma-glutamyl ligase-like protein